ncbi:septum formation inhibitor Maf [Thalassotalea litorea]|uniref:7-methyl-GTP pyrophosphatase n=1 Tax=Thalassotalea litorea TaxID=2020715 RepID=A0A5R9IS44_9GAMM|nr:nucleoside triphosphate pyrophosphatase [Thalassotalea litorea]TLU68092.1 septum formation inhibitor Maf [Thalassotalea litorea]
MKTLVLGSTSVFRKAILEKLNLNFICDKPDIDETPLPHETPEQLVERLALGKAKKVAESHRNALIIGSDQVAVHQGEILGKPGSCENAINQLMRFSGDKVTFLTSLCLYNSGDDSYQVIVEPFNVYFRELSLTQVTAYVNAEQPLHCAGSFKSEGLGICLFERLEGDDPNSLIGLPLIGLTKLLANQGIDVLALQA